ncbi:acetoin reductase family protein [Lentinus brumalis]|uniref:Acetoin reductase family protein n=1 Tax=Lentinus brumalis TaxID=2498619 RepID=A0A371DPT8_9APHY|nr:acetoin reductase family protein [Polyporus brumalis]
MASSTKRVAIVTGAAQGIGRGIAQRLAKDGLHLGLFDLPNCKESLEELASSLREEFGTKVVTVYGDVSVEDDVRRSVDTVVHELGELYAMIANAGICCWCELHETSTDLVDKLLDVNIKGVFFCYKYAAMQLIKQGKGGRIVGATSIVGKRGSRGQSVYSATKFAVRGLTQSAAMDYGKYGITVNAYAPGAVDTPLLWKVDEDRCAHEGLPQGTWRNSVMKQYDNSLGRAGQPEDIAKAVSFLVSDDAAFITGQSLTVDGGKHFD